MVTTTMRTRVVVQPPLTSAIIAVTEMVTEGGSDQLTGRIDDMRKNAMVTVATVTMTIADVIARILVITMTMKSIVVSVVTIIEEGRQIICTVVDEVPTPPTFSVYIPSNMARYIAIDSAKHHPNMFSFSLKLGMSRKTKVRALDFSFVEQKQS